MNELPTTASVPTERVVRDFIREVVAQLAPLFEGAAHEFETTTRWERGPDGHFRERKRLRPVLWKVLAGGWLSQQPNYQTCIDAITADVVIGPHFNCLVGTSQSTFRLTVDQILNSLIYAMFDDEGRLAFSNERFQDGWNEMMGFFGATTVRVVTVAPLPSLAIPSFPLQLNDEIALDRLTDEEVNRCYLGGIILPMSPQFPVVDGAVGVGVRRVTRVPKVMRRGDEPIDPTIFTDEGSFGRRPVIQSDLTIDDVLTALRLFKRTKVRGLGYASWAEAFSVAGAISFRGRGQWPFHGSFELSEAEVPKLLELWRCLERGSKRLGFSIHRFMLAFERGLLVDRIVDLVISAEAMLLADTDENSRGELRFRFALRAAKFIEHPHFNEQETYQVMRRAYDARSTVVHGGSPKDTRLPDNQAADLSTFTDAIEDLVRLALKKALAMGEDAEKLRQSGYWESQLFSHAAR